MDSKWWTLLAVCAGMFMLLLDVTIVVVAFGVWGAVTGVSTALGPVLGGVITTDWSWRGIFLVNVPIGVLAVALTAWRVEESKSPHPTPPDWPGFALLTTGLVSLIYG